jgi:hypothetical protein
MWAPAGAFTPQKTKVSQGKPANCEIFPYSGIKPFDCMVSSGWSGLLFLQTGRIFHV